VRALRSSAVPLTLLAPVLMGGCQGEDVGQGAGAGGASSSGGASTGGVVTDATGGEAAGGGATGGDGPSGGLATGGDTGGDGASGTGGAAALPAPVVSGLVVEPNPNSTLSAYVSWTTDVPADSAVEFGVGGYEFRIRDEAAVTEHRVLVIGMHADSTYALRAVSTTAGGSGSAEGTFATGSLPDIVPLPALSVAATDPRGDWTLVSAQPASDSFTDRPPGVFVMYDEQGIPVWYWVNGDQADELGDASVEFLPNGNLLVGPTTFTPPQEVDLAGNVVWRGPEQPDGGGDGAQGLMTHDVRKLSNGNYVLLRNVYDADEFEGALVEEVTPTYEVVWSFNLFDQLTPDPLVDDPDWCHPNAISIDEEQGFLYLSCRWLGVMKIERDADPAIVWILGEGLDGGSFAFDPPESGFSDQHDPELHEDGTILIFDNGGFTLRPTGDEHTQVLEYALDEATMTARLVWSFPGDFAVDAFYTDDWYTPFWGDADRLANGDVLITDGQRNRTVEGRIFEVRREDGQVVWELTFPPNEGTYQAERLSPPPLVERL
jgi:hypothetical protein